MASRVDEWQGTVAMLADRLHPRDDAIVAEVPLEGADDRTVGHGPVSSHGSVTFRAAHGPFRTYERRVEWASTNTTSTEADVDVHVAGPADQPEAEPDRTDCEADPATAEVGRVDITQHVEWRLAIPYWGWLYRPLVGRALRDGVAAGSRPWWLFPDRLSVRQARAVSTMALFSLVSGLLYGQLTQVLTFASADIGNGTSGQQASIFALVRIGAVLTAVMMFQADRFGRRRIALWSFSIAVALSFITALVPGLGALTVLQAIARNLAVAGLLAVDTICVEELPAGSRAMASGLGAMAYGLGSGIVVIALPLADLAPWSWRLVFGLSILMAPLVLWGSRTLEESRRFQALDTTGSVGSEDRSDAASHVADTGADWNADANRTGLHAQPGAHDRLIGAFDAAEMIDPASAGVAAAAGVGATDAARTRESTRIRGGRFVLLAALFVLINVFIAPVSQLQNDYLRADRGFDGMTITIFTLLTGTPAALGVIVGGRLADTRGRRWALVPGLIALGVFTAAFFAISGAPMWFSALIASVLGTLTVAPLGVLAPELFPTSRRGGARGMLNVLAVCGSVAGLLLAGTLVDQTGYGATFTLLAVGPLIAAGLAFAVPETRGRELEDINRAD